MKLDYFVQKLAECIQEKSAIYVDDFLNRNNREWKHDIPIGMISLAICSTTITNKIELKESPVITLKILHKWGVDLTENDCNAVRMLLYSFYTLEDDDPVLNASFEIIEYILTNTDLTIQSFDCRGLEEDVGLMMISCAMNIDHSTNESIAKINKLRNNRMNLIQIFLLNVCKIEHPYNKIIAEYAWGGHYEFHFDEDDYDPLSGDYAE